MKIKLQHCNICEPLNDLITSINGMLFLIISLSVKFRVVPDLLFPNPAGAGFCRILVANPAGAGAGAGLFTIATT